MIDDLHGCAALCLYLEMGNPSSQKQDNRQSTDQSEATLRCHNFPFYRTFFRSISPLTIRASNKTGNIVNSPSPGYSPDRLFTISLHSLRIDCLAQATNVTNRVQPAKRRI